MSSIKKLKKNINNQIGEFIEDIYNWELLNPDKDLSKSEKLIDDSIKVFDLLISKINSVNKENSKKEFKSINKERLKKALQKEVEIETICILNSILKFFKTWNQKITDTIRWPEYCRKINKYAPFLKYNDVQYKLILKEIINKEHEKV